MNNYYAPCFYRIDFVLIPSYIELLCFDTIHYKLDFLVPLRLLELRFLYKVFMLFYPHFHLNPTQPRNRKILSPSYLRALLPCWKMAQYSLKILLCFAIFQHYVWKVKNIRKPLEFSCFQEAFMLIFKTLQRIYKKTAFKKSEVTRSAPQQTISLQIV